MTAPSKNIKTQALQILKSLLAQLPAITADIQYQKLRDEGFTEDEAVRVTGSCFRTANSLGWVQKTNLCQNSVKNHSNLQKIWKSKLFDGKRDATAALAGWSRRGFTVPLNDLCLWEQTQAKNVSK